MVNPEQYYTFAKDEALARAEAAKHYDSGHTYISADLAKLIKANPRVISAIY